MSVTWRAKNVAEWTTADVQMWLGSRADTQPAKVPLQGLDGPAVAALGLKALTSAPYSLSTVLANRVIDAVAFKKRAEAASEGMNDLLASLDTMASKTAGADAPPQMPPRKSSFSTHKPKPSAVAPAQAKTGSAEDEEAPEISPRATPPASSLAPPPVPRSVSFPMPASPRIPPRNPGATCWVKTEVVPPIIPPVSLQPQPQPQPQPQQAPPQEPRTWAAVVAGAPAAAPAHETQPSAQAQTQPQPQPHPQSQAVKALKQQHRYTKSVGGTQRPLPSPPKKNVAKVPQKPSRQQTQNRPLPVPPSKKSVSPSPQDSPRSRPGSQDVTAEQRPQASQSPSFSDDPAATADEFGEQQQDEQEQEQDQEQEQEGESQEPEREGEEYQEPEEAPQISLQPPPLPTTPPPPPPVQRDTPPTAAGRKAPSTPLPPPPVPSRVSSMWNIKPVGAKVETPAKSFSERDIAGRPTKPPRNNSTESLKESQTMAEDDSVEAIEGDVPIDIDSDSDEEGNGDSEKSTTWSAARKPARAPPATPAKNGTTDAMLDKPMSQIRPTAGARGASSVYGTIRSKPNPADYPFLFGVDPSKSPGIYPTPAGSSTPPASSASALSKLGGMFRSFGSRSAEQELFILKGPLPSEVIRGDAHQLVEAIKEMDKYPPENPAFMDHWTSRPPLLEQWETTYAVPTQSLVDPAAQPDGYHIEASRAAVTKTHKNDEGNLDVILYAEDDYPFFKEFIMPRLHEHYCSLEGPAGPTIVSVELQNEMGVAKAVVRTKKDTKRIAFPPMKTVKSINSVLPVQFKDHKFTKVKANPEFSEQLVTYDEKSKFKKYKFGVIFVGPNQSEENEIFANISGTPEYEEFLHLMGEKIPLKGWSKYRGGLDVNADNTGTHSHYTSIGQYEIMFHVATLLPYQPDDLQKVERKRHIGNDVCVIVFKDQSSPEDRFHPKILTSHFNHSFFVVSPIKDESGVVTHYNLTIANKPAVPPYPPFYKEGDDALIFPKGPEFARFLLLKMLNAERSALAGSAEFASVITTRKQQLANMCKQYS